MRPRPSRYNTINNGSLRAMTVYTVHWWCYTYSLRQLLHASPWPVLYQSSWGVCRSSWYPILIGQGSVYSAEWLVLTSCALLNDMVRPVKRCSHTPEWQLGTGHEGSVYECVHLMTGKNRSLRGVHTCVNDHMTSHQGAYTPLMTCENRLSRDSTPFNDQ
jgi:hypothetical protein